MPIISHGLEFQSENSSTDNSGIEERTRLNSDMKPSPITYSQLSTGFYSAIL